MGESDEKKQYQEIGKLQGLVEAALSTMNRIEAAQTESSASINRNFDRIYKKIETNKEAMHSELDAHKREQDKSFNDRIEPLEKKVNSLYQKYWYFVGAMGAIVVTINIVLWLVANFYLR